MTYISGRSEYVCIGGLNGGKHHACILSIGLFHMLIMEEAVISLGISLYGVALIFFPLIMIEVDKLDANLGVPLDCFFKK